MPLKVTVTVLPLAVALFTDDMLLLNAAAASAFSMLMVNTTSAPVRAPRYRLGRAADPVDAVADVDGVGVAAPGAA